MQRQLKIEDLKKKFNYFIKVKMKMKKKSIFKNEGIYLKSS